MATKEACILSINCSEERCYRYEAVYPDMICTLIKSWYSGVMWCTRKQMATVVRDITMKPVVIERNLLRRIAGVKIDTKD